MQVGLIPTPEAPRQNRSKVIVKSIIEATYRLLNSIGGARITTTKVADLAGVSIGSLYQYFPNKESLFSAIFDLTMRSQIEKFRDKLNEIGNASFEESVHELNKCVVELAFRDRKIQHELGKRGADLSRLPIILKLHQEGAEKCAQIFARRCPGLKPEDYLRYSFVATNSVLGVIQKMILDESQTYTIEELVLELDRLVISYAKSVIAERSEIFSPLRPGFS